MTITIDLTPETVDRLHAEAAARGQTTEEYLRDLVADRFRFRAFRGREMPPWVAEVMACMPPAQRSHPLDRLYAAHRARKQMRSSERR